MYWKEQLPKGQQDHSYGGTNQRYLCHHFPQSYRDIWLGVLVWWKGQGNWVHMCTASSDVNFTIEFWPVNVSIAQISSYIKWCYQYLFNRNTSDVCATGSLTLTKIMYLYFFSWKIKPQGSMPSPLPLSLPLFLPFPLPPLSVSLSLYVYMLHICSAFFFFNQIGIPQ